VRVAHVPGVVAPPFRGAGTAALGATVVLDSDVNLATLPAHRHGRGVGLKDAQAALETLALKTPKPHVVALTKLDSGLDLPRVVAGHCENACQAKV
jgi:hypothetical protein